MKTTIDTTLLPKVWLIWQNKDGNHWLECATGKKFDTKPNVEFSWSNRDHILYNSGSHPHFAYLKYHQKEEMLEIAAVTLPTTRKEEVKEWTYAGDKYFIKKDKTVLDENGNAVTSSFNLYKYHVGRNFKDFLSMWTRLSYHPNVMKEFHKFIGGTDYTIGNGRVVDANYSWHVQDWYIKQVARSTNGKQQKLVNSLTDIPLSDVSDFAKKYPEIVLDGSRWYSDRISNLLYFERLEGGWSVLRMLKRVGEEVVESERMYLHDDGTNRIATKTKNGWIPASQFREWSTYYQFVNKDEAMEKCNRLKYLLPLFDSGEKNIKRYLQVALRFPEVEQFMKLGYKQFAQSIANSSTPAADLRHAFGEYYNQKETNLLRKIGMTKYQLDQHMAKRTHSSYWHINGSSLGDMREFFGDDLSPIDNATFDKYYNAFSELRNQAHGFKANADRINLDYHRFLRNAIRLKEKHSNVFTMLRDTMSAYLNLNHGTQPAIDWYFENYSDIVRAHDAIEALRQEQYAERRAMWDLGEKERRKKEEEKRIKLDEKRKEYEYEDDNYLIRLPKDGAEIVNEGSRQRICIGGYVSRHSLGETNLFFIRQKADPDTPFYAIEMRGGNIIQIHGYCNKWLGCNPEVIPTVIRWLRKNGIKCDDKILTCKAQGYGAINQYVPMPVVD